MPFRAGTTSVHDVFIGRQPIYDRQLEAVAYEILFRSGEVNHADFVDGDQATSQVFLNTFMEIGLSTIVGNKRAFINVTRSFLLQQHAYVFPADRLVIEILEDITVDPPLLEAVQNLATQGYTIALDDFIYHDHLQPLVELADIIKIDLLALDRSMIEQHVARLRPYGVALLAEKVETQEDFAYCKDLGFDYFQGYFFCKPTIIKGQRLPANRLALLLLLSKLQQANASLRDIEDILSRDVTLSYKVLRTINSAFYARSKKVETLRQALLLLGTTVITSMASMMLLAGVNDKPHELMVTALARARMCALLARVMQYDNEETFFLVGFFSILDAMMDRPMEEILQELPLTDDISEALLSWKGVLGRVLACVLAYEHGDWEDVGTFGLDRDVLTTTYLEAIAWAAEMSRYLGIMANS